MQLLSNYRIVDTVLSTQNWILYKAVAKEYKRTVLLKVNKDQASNPQTTAELIHEYYLLKENGVEGVLQPIAIEKHRTQSFLVMEYFQGEGLSDWLDKHKFLDLAVFLKIALNLTEIVSSIHQKNIIHKSIQPDNILLHPHSGKIIVTGFQHSTTLSKEMPQTDMTPYQLERIAYLSPEQTGRMNRPIDYRTDFYSLGVLFYRMITGHLPFEMEEPAEIIHAHLAQTATHPVQLQPTIPKVISNLIMKLLSKMPEQRYQSTYGLKKDLEECLHRFRTTGEIALFPLGEHDISPILEKPNKLYGRATELHYITEKLDTIEEGIPELLLIPGPSGIGKTAIVNELQKQLLRKKGYFISGKFTQYQKHIPYAPFIEAFRSLVRQILTEDTESIEKWRETIKVAMATNAWLIASFVPEIEWLIGKQEEGPEIPPQGVHNRFLLAVRNFVDVFATRNHPLVLFIDDLQWADNATLDLMKHLLKNPNQRNMLIIGAYRDNEVSIGHPFELFLKHVKQEDVPVSTLPLHPLTIAHMNQWVEELFLLEGESKEQLVALLSRITKGNPFYMIQLLQLLHHENVIFFNLHTAKWEVNLQALKHIPMTESMVDFIMKQLDKLPLETTELLQLAACIGNQFNLNWLATVKGEDYVDLAHKLWHGLEEGFIIPLDARYKWVYPNENQDFLNENPPSYRFSHDKIQQAFYSSMSKREQENNHMKIAVELIRSYTDEEIQEHIFTLVNHLNVCQARLDAHEKSELIKWNRMAGEKAKQAAAFKTALSYYRTAYHLMPQNKWEYDYDETYKVLIGYGETLYLDRQFEKAEQMFEDVLLHAKTIQDQLSIYNLKIMLYTHIHEVKKATNSGLEGLRLYGWNINNNPNKWGVAKEYILTKLALGKKTTEDLMQLSRVTDENQRLIMRTLINTNAPTYHVNQNLATILMLRALRLTLKFGDMDVSALVYNNYALTLSAGFGDYSGSYQFGELAIQHVNKTNDNALKARVFFVFGSFVNHWKNHIRYNQEYLEKSQQLCIETGNFHLAGANSAFIVLTQHIKGDALQELKDGIDRQLTFAKKNEYALSDNLLQELLDWISLLSTPNMQPTWDFSSFTDDISAAIIHYTLRLQMSYLFDNPIIAKALIRELEPLVDNTLVLVIAPEYFFYHSLWLIKLMDLGEITSKSGKKKLKKDIAKLAEWAKHSPDNYRHKYLLIRAEQSRLNNNDTQAIRDYHEAITNAEENEFLPDVAIANHRAASFYLSRQLPKTAKGYFTEAYNSYLDWGATNIAAQLKATTPHLLLNMNRMIATDFPYEGHLDVEAIFQTARVISGEVVLEHLISKLMDIFLTYAGAEHASFLLNYPDGLKLMAYKQMKSQVEVYQQPKSITYQSRLSTAIVNYVFNSREEVVLANAVEQGAFIKNDYVQSNKVKSVLCLPIIYQHKLVAVLYMENNQSSDVFTQERLQLLTLIASQAAVSIENAYLYADLEEKVQERTNLLQDANQNLTNLNQQLTSSKEQMKHLFSNVSHELQTPIAVVKGYIDALLDGLVHDPTTQKDYLKIVKGRIESLNELIKDLFDLSKLESGTITFTMEAIPVDQLYDHVCDMFAIEIKQAGLNFKKHLQKIHSMEQPLVEVDVMRIEQVMTNLVSNALKHTNKGAIEIGLIVGEADQVTFYVRDEGIGIPESYVPYVFDRFYTKRTPSMQKGNGLGLAICKEIISRHNGSVWVESEEGKGATFYFSLPQMSFTVFS